MQLYYAFFTLFSCTFCILRTVQLTAFLKHNICRFLIHHSHYVNALFGVHFLNVIITTILLQKIMPWNHCYNCIFYTWWNIIYSESMQYEPNYSYLTALPLHFQFNYLQCTLPVWQQLGFCVLFYDLLLWGFFLSLAKYDTPSNEHYWKGVTLTGQTN